MSRKNEFKKNGVALRTRSCRAFMGDENMYEHISGPEATEKQNIMYLVPHRVKLGGLCAKSRWEGVSKQAMRKWGSRCRK